jgi:hypothetical protein
MAQYEFVTIWRFKAPQEQVWDLIFHFENWPDWWRGVEKVEKLQEGSANHVGAIHRYAWKSKLPYRLIFEMKTTRVEPMTLIEGEAIGELQGLGRWQLSNRRRNYHGSLRLESGNYQTLDEPARSHSTTLLQLEPRRGNGLGRRGLSKAPGSQGDLVGARLVPVRIDLNIETGRHRPAPTAFRVRQAKTLKLTS